MQIWLNRIKFNRSVVNNYVISKVNMHIGGTHASDSSKISKKSEVENTSC